MTDTDHDGWPDKYRDRPRPDVLCVTVETFDRMREETLEVIEAADEGESPPAVVSFGTVGELRKILTDRRTAPGTQRHRRRCREYQRARRGP